MTTPPQPPEPPEKPERPDYAPPPGLAFRNTPNAEKYVLEADAMRRRQMRSALLHGSRRTWRDYGRIWPAVVVGIIVVAVIIAGLAVSRAFQETKRNQEKEQAKLEERNSPSAPRTPGRSASPAPGATSPTP